MMMGPESIAFRLVKEGYDVWLNNSRGNLHSMEHQTLPGFSKTSRKMPISKVQKERIKKEYYDFSFHELGLFDQPAVWKYIINFTGQQKISYVGHS